MFKAIINTGFFVFFATLLYSAQWDEGTSTNLFVKFNIDEKWFLTSRNNIVSRDGIDDFFFGYVDLNLGYQFHKDWSLEAGYRHGISRHP